MDNKKVRKLIFKELLPNPKRERARFNMTLGSFIKALKRERKGLHVVTDSGQSIGIVHGYPGYQGDLAFCISTVPITIAELINHCDEIMNRVIQGPNGPMIANHGSPLWICDTANKKGQAVLDVVADTGVIKLILENIEDE